MTPQRMREAEYGLWLLKWSEDIKTRPLAGRSIREIWVAGHAAALNPRTEAEVLEDQSVAIFADELRRRPIQA